MPLELRVQGIVVIRNRKLIEAPVEGILVFFVCVPNLESGQFRLRSERFILLFGDVRQAHVCRVSVDRMVQALVVAADFERRVAGFQDRSDQLARIP